MSPGMQQFQKMSLEHVLAPQMQQSLQILQAPILELRNLVQQEIQANPVLEEEITEPSVEDRLNDQEDFREEFDQLVKLDDEWRDYMAQSAAYSGRSQEEEERRQHFFDSISSPETLQQHLSEQLAVSELSEDDRSVADLIIGSVDDLGFLQTPLADIAKNSGIELADLERTLEFVQTFHPVGVGARDLRDCLLIQLRRLGKADSLEYRIVANHLEDLAKKRYPEIARKLGTTVDQIQRTAQFIATLDPKPGQIFTFDPHNYVLPDVVVERVGDGYQVNLSGDQIPHLRISNTYKDLMAQEGSNEELKEYIREKIRGGKFLIKSIHQRQQTISNIANEIVKRQPEFMEKGAQALKPMTMVQVAEAVGVHETTVSRAVSGKYIATPQGVFEMKYFFTPGYQTADGKTMSNTGVKDAIADFVKSENPLSPMSDQEIVKLLSERGIPIARRTVAKYRNELGILPSNMRKSF